MPAGKILIIDPDKSMCELLRIYLEREGYTVITSGDGEEGLVKFSALKPAGGCASRNRRTAGVPRNQEEICRTSHIYYC